MIKKTKNRMTRRKLAKIVTVIFVVPVAVSVLWNCAVLLGESGERAAILSAAILLPDSGVLLLKERFQAEIYNPEAEEEMSDSERQPSRPPGSEAEPENEPPQKNESEGKPQSIEKPSVGQAAVKIPEKYAAELISENFSGVENSITFRVKDLLIRNETSWTEKEIKEILERGWHTKPTNSAEPQVLILHTHATESFEKYDSEIYDTRGTWRDTDNNANMVAVGRAMEQVLEEYGVTAIHDETQHDYPSYNGAYQRSAQTIEKYLKEYPTIKIVLDLHRDAMQRGEAIVKPVAVVNGRKAAQVMIISACEDESTDVPKWRENFRFAYMLQGYAAKTAPGLMRPIYLAHRKYNMDLTTGSLLIEFGSNANTLDEAVYAGELIGQALGILIQENSAG